MKELEYPFDTELLINKRRKIRRQLLSDSNSVFASKKIAILGGSTTDNIRQFLEIFLLNQGIRPEFYESEYNQYYQDALFPNEKLREFRPDIVYIHTTNRNITAFPNLDDDRSIIENMLQSEYGKFVSVWDSIFNIFKCPIIQNNFEMPLYRLLGNREAYDVHGAVNYITRLNMKFYDYAQNHENFFICDINYISADYGLKEWSNPFYWHMYKYALNVNAIPYLSYNVSNIIKSIYGKNKKGMVLDLDNTLWGGVIGDDGVEGIELGPEESSGQLYSEFQRYIKAHKQLGVLLNVDSKNDEKNALAGLNHPDSELGPDDFIVIKANWEPKDINLCEIAKDLNLLPESLLFIDDNPAERHIVTEQIEGVVAPEIGESHRYIQNIDRGGYFETTYLSQDDLKRVSMYKENAQRRILESRFTDYHEYLLSLGMKAVIKPFESIYLARIAQLTNKSNQFNLTTRRFSESEIAQISSDPEYISLYGKLSDRFGDNGVVTVVICHVIDNVCHIILWLMSCRVLKRDMEFAMMDALVRVCKKRNIDLVRGYYYPTEKNSMVKDFYDLMGFTKISENDKGDTEWEYSIPEDYTNKTDVIEMEE